jgi:hypothetical protein
MSVVEDICKLIDGCTEAEQRAIFHHLRKRLVLHPLESEWDINAETILSAIRRSSDLTLRGIRGIIAEATFEDIVVPQLAADWEAQLIQGDQSYDFHLLRRRDRFAVRIQVKLQRKEKQAPKVVSLALRRRLIDPPEVLYVVEVQRTRTGKRSLKNAAGETLDETKVEETRPYRYGEFDILAVSMHPSTRDWKRFMYTVSDWLLPRPDAGLVQIMQPVPAVRDSYWTDNLSECIEWFDSHQQRRLYGHPGAERREQLDEAREQVSFLDAPEEQ